MPIECPLAPLPLLSPQPLPIDSTAKSPLKPPHPLGLPTAPSLGCPPPQLRLPPTPLYPPAANLPPTLAKSQVSSVRKNLKLHLLSVLRHPSSGDFQPQITTLLVDLGTQQAEIARSMPSPRDARKRARDDPDAALKKMKLGEGSCWGRPSHHLLSPLGPPGVSSGSSWCHP